MAFVLTADDQRSAKTQPAEDVAGGAPFAGVHIRPLDGVRGLAALAVFFHHSVFTVIDWSKAPPIYLPLVWFSHACQHGVDIFFVLSGYLITSILLSDNKYPKYYWIFYVKRITRILPIYFTIVVFVAVFIPQSRNYLFLSALFLANFAEPLHITEFGPFWTLAIEEQFYAVWPIIVRNFSRSTLRLVALAIVLAEPALRFVDTLVGHHNFRFTFFHADGLAFGALLALGAPGASPKTSARNSAMRLIAGFALYAPSMFHLGHILDGLAEAFQLTAVGLIGYAIIGACVAKPRAAAVSWLGAPPLTFLGVISYSFYLIHLYVFMVYDKLVGRLVGPDLRPILARMAVGFVVTTAICVVSRYVIELPGMKLRKPLLAL